MRPQPLIDHPGRKRTAGQVGADAVDRERLDPFVRVAPRERAQRPEDARAVDEDVCSAEPLFRRVVKAVDVLRLAHIGGGNQRVGLTDGRQQPESRLEVLARSSGEDDLRPVFRKRGREISSEAAPGTDDDRDPTGQVVSA